MTPLVQTAVDAARSDLRRHTLDQMRGDFSRLVYLASTRDYATARYYHDGLALGRGSEVVDKALETCHQEVFLSLALGSLEAMVEALDAYIRSTGVEPAQIISTWQQLQPFRIAVPLTCKRIVAEMFFSNVTVALEILRYRAPRPS